MKTDRATLPALFIGHGSPMNTLDLNRYTQSWREVGKSIPKPRAVLVVSSHWYFGATAVTAMAKPRTIHDFYGFSEELLSNILKMVKLQITDHMELNKKIRAFRHAIYWLQKLRLKSDPFLLFTQQPYSWIEIDGIRIPDAVLFQITCEQDSKNFLQSFELHNIPALKENSI